MRRLELAASLIWGALLAFLLLGAVLEPSVGLIVYAVCALGVWAGCFARGRRLIAIPLSLLGPLAIVPVAFVRWRKAHPSPRPKQPTEPARAAPPPPPAPPPEPPRAPRPPKEPKHPYQVLAVMLIGSILAFPVVGLAILTLIALATTPNNPTNLTAHDISVISVISGVVAGLVLLSTALVWQERSVGSSSKARRIGWSLIIAVAVPIAAGTLVFARGTSPRDLSRPSVSGSAVLGSTLTGHPGRWTGPGRGFSFTYYWEECNPECNRIYGAIDSTYTPVRSDLQKRIRLSVYASPEHGGILGFDSNWVYSRETAPVVP